MARRKETIWQTDFSLGQFRNEAEERSDTEIARSSVQGALNTLTLASGQIEGRPGFVYVGTASASGGWDIDLGNGREYELQLEPTGYRLLDQTGAVVTEETALEWTGLGSWNLYSFKKIEFWVVASPDTQSILIGSKYFPIHALTVSADDIWSFGQAQYPAGQDGVPAIPFFKPQREGRIRVIKGAGRSVTIDSDFDLFRGGHGDTYIRLNGVPMYIDTVVDARQATGTSMGPVPRTIVVGVADSGDFYEGDVVEHKNLGGQGIITDITGNDLTIFCTGSFKDFDATGNLIGPNAKEAITSYTVQTTGAYVGLWDIQMFSDAYGYAGWGQLHKGRLYLCGYPSDSLAYAASVAGDILNFTAGAQDADAFVEKIGVQRGGRLLYILSTEDLLFLTTRGLYYQRTRGNDAITPTTIAPVAFAQLGVAEIRPVTFDDGVIFVDGPGKQVHAALLTGDIDRAWRTRSISRFHSDVVKNPVYLGATAFGSERPESFIYAVNEDGTCAVCQLDREEGTVSWRPWATEGKFVAVYQSLSKTHAIIDRTLNGVSVRTYERMEYGVYVDSASCLLVNDTPGGDAGLAGQDFFGGKTAFAVHLDGEMAQVYLEGWDYGDLTINSAGRPVSNGAAMTFPTDAERILQIGLPIEVEVIPWSKRSVETQRGVRAVKRLIDFYATVQSTGIIEIDGQEFGGYKVGESLDAPPPLRSDQYRVAKLGNAAFEITTIRKRRPGPFRLLKIGHRVTV